MTANQILSNPYNQLGHMHNEGIEFVLDSINPFSTIEQIIQTVASYLQKIAVDGSSEASVAAIIFPE